MKTPRLSLAASVRCSTPVGKPRASPSNVMYPPPNGPERRTVPAGAEPSAVVKSKLAVGAGSGRSITVKGASGGVTVLLGPVIRRLYLAPVSAVLAEAIV